MTVPKKKIAITIDAELLERVNALVKGGHATSVSAYIEHTVRCQLAAEATFDRLVTDSLRASGGPAKRAERAAARKLLGRAA